MNETTKHAKFIEGINKREEELMRQGYKFVIKAPENVSARSTIGNWIDRLTQKEMGGKEYIILPENLAGSSHKLYAKNL